MKRLWLSRVARMPPGLTTRRMDFKAWTGSSPRRWMSIWWEWEMSKESDGMDSERFVASPWTNSMFVRPSALTRSLAMRMESVMW